MNRRVNYKTIEELKLLQVQYILNSASDSFKGPKWHMRLYKNPGTSLRVSMGMQLSFRSHWWLRCLEDERCNRAELSRALGRWVPQHQCCGKVPGKFSRRFEAENERSQRLSECSSIWGEGKKLCGWWKGLKTFESFLFLALWGKGLPGYWGRGLIRSWSSFQKVWSLPGSSATSRVRNQDDGEWESCGWHDEVLFVYVLGYIVTEFIIQDDNRFHFKDRQPLFLSTWDADQSRGERVP